MKQEFGRVVRLGWLGATMLSLGCMSGSRRQKESASGNVALSTAGLTTSVSVRGVVVVARTSATQMQRMLTELGTLRGMPIETLRPVEARKQPTPSDAVKALRLKEGRSSDRAPLVSGISAVDRSIPGAAGSIDARISTPTGAGPFPVIGYFHGGCFVLADRAIYDGGARGLATRGNSLVIKVDDRPVPEHRFPAEHDDALATHR